MTKTARDLRSAAHALRTAANTLGETVTALRALSDDLNEPAVPAWPTAPHVWHAGEVWTRQEDGLYESAGDLWEEGHMINNPSPEIRAAACRFAREAVPVTLVPTEAWEEWERLALPDHHDAALVDAVDSLAQEVAR